MLWMRVARSEKQVPCIKTVLPQLISLALELIAFITSASASCIRRAHNGLAPSPRGMASGIVRAKDNPNQKWLRIVRVKDNPLGAQVQCADREL